MCENSLAPDGDWQGDGWGIAWKENNIRVRPLRRLRSDPESKWEIYKSLKPIWNDKSTFSNFPETNNFAVHARSAGFPQDKGIIEYNQPYVSDDMCFVFNGMIKGVKIDKPLIGKIGAQKIFSLIQNVILSDPELIEGESKDPYRISKALRTVDKLILASSQKILGMNIGLTKDNKFYILCEYDNNPTYFGIRFHQDAEISIVCSEPIGKYDWETMKKGEVLVV